MKILTAILVCLSINKVTSSILKFDTATSAQRQSKDYHSPRIIDGYKARRGQFPYQAALLYDGSFECGGALISNTWVLTAAHCVTELADMSKLYVELGAQTLNIHEEGRVTLNVTAIPHPDWDEGLLRNDVALLKLSEPVKFSEYIQSIKLPRYSEDGVYNEGKRVQVSGWGYTSWDATSTSNELNYLNLTVISNDECEQYYVEGYVTNTTICTANIDGAVTCTGDSGGPLVIQNSEDSLIHIGIVSFVGWGCSGPAAYTRVASYLHWISEVSGIEIDGSTN